MANPTRRRLSFVDLTHPQVWNKLFQYTQVTLTLTELITDFTDQWMKIYLESSMKLDNLVKDFRRKTELNIQAKCHLGGMMYDLWESLLLESDIESQSLKKVSSVMEKKIIFSLRNFREEKLSQMKMIKYQYEDFNDILNQSHRMIQDVQNKYSKIYNNQGVSPDYHCVHNEYVLELAGVNALYSRYQSDMFPQMLQDMEKSQLETIETICRNIQLIAAVFQEYHEQRQSSYGSFVVTSTRTDPNEELENYICSMNESTDKSVHSPVQIHFESFISPNPSRSQPNSNTTNTEQLIIYAAPVIQMHLSSRCKETIDRLREIKKEKSLLLAIVNPQTTKIPVKQRDEQQQSDKKILHQMSDLLKRKHQLRLIELEESVLLAQQDLLKSHRPSMSNMADSEQETAKRTTATKNFKGLWRDAFRALKNSTTTGTTDEENRSSFVRRISSRKKKRNSEREREDDQPVIDPVYETLKEAAETRKRTLAIYLQQRQQSLNKQTSLNSQGSSELEIQPSPAIARHNDSSSSSQAQASSLSSGKRASDTRFSDVVETYQLTLSTNE